MIRQLFSTFLCVASVALLQSNTSASPFVASSDFTPNPVGVYISTNPVSYPVPSLQTPIVISQLQLSGASTDSPFTISYELKFGDGGEDSGQAVGIVDPNRGGQNYDAEWMNFHVHGLPPGEPWIDFELRESPTITSPGHVTVDPLPGGLFRIDSFFDIFTEISIDGGQTWVPGSGPMHLTSIPEPSSLILATLGLIGFATWVNRRKSAR